MTISNFAGAPSETDVKLAVDVAATLGAKPGELKDDLLRQKVFWLPSQRSFLVCDTNLITGWANARLIHEKKGRNGTIAPSSVYL